MLADPTPVRVTFIELPDLASEVVGGSVCACDDDFFAGAANLVKRTFPAFDPDAFAHTGKIMDGWESQRGRRRNRTDGRSCDTAIVALGIPGDIVGIDVNTAHFLANSPQSVELHGAVLAPGADPAAPDVTWIPLAPRTQTAPNTRNLIAVAPAARGQRISHVRLVIHPDGGVARLRAHGYGMPSPGALEVAEEVDLAAVVNGAIAIAASDQFYGGISNLLLPGESQRMDEGWETGRTRDRSPDEWVVVRLAAPGRVRRVTMDTSWFKGNAPDTARLEGVFLGERASTVDPGADELDWVTLVPDHDIGPHASHEFDSVAPDLVVDHVRLVIEPDGGIARLRVWGDIASPDEVPA